MKLPRTNEPELMDRPAQDPVELRESLRQVAAVNRWLGGTRSLRAALEPVVDARPTGVLLDVGCGNGEILDGLVRWARARRSGRGWSGVGLDLHPDVLAVARRDRAAPDRVALLRGEALELPLADASVDAAISSLVLHHFDRADAVRVVREMARVARSLVVVSDLQRSLPHWLAARLLAATVWRGNRLTRHDGPLSVRRSFTAEELAEIGREAGLRDVRVRRFLPFRLALQGRPSGEAA